MNYLIDTNICIYIMNRKPPDVIRKFKTFDIGMIGISSITVSELCYGASKSRDPRKNMERLNDFLTPFEILPYDHGASVIYGSIRTDLELKGTPIGPMDLLIAAHALSRDLVLVTNNEKEFKRIAQLTVENWA